MNKKSILFFLFVAVLAMNLASQEQCKVYSTDNESIIVRVTKLDGKVSRGGYRYNKYEVTIRSAVDKKTAIKSCKINSVGRSILEVSPVGEVLNNVGSFTFTYLCTSTLKASDVSVTATICE